MKKNTKKVRAHILILGRVQGVAFRYYTQDVAQNLEIKGWVRNCWDGKVEIVMEGEKRESRAINKLVLSGTGECNCGKSRYRMGKI